ncbi:MAG: DinB family protein [Anaerobacillus sp.]
MTEPRSVLDEYASLTNWLHKTAMEMEEKVFFMPIKPGKWSPAEILSHIREWDEYLLNERIPYIHHEAQLSKLDVNVEEVNEEAAAYARSGISKDQMITETLNGRERVVATLRKLNENQWNETFYIDKYPLCLTSYMKGLIEHDEHHKMQIEVFMANQGIPISLFST